MIDMVEVLILAGPFCFCFKEFFLISLIIVVIMMMNMLIMGSAGIFQGWFLCLIMGIQQQ